ncbi:MAG TPA: S26 family signal peptidase [Candidatus Eremiobacteraceae bacterium]|nr:S26 family signal peptidase [Candidatus Eremiobacteraceae bacterium]
MTVRGPLVGIIFGVIAMLGAAWFKPAIQLVFNPTDSAPRGWYFITPAARFRVGDYVVAQIPRAAASLAAARGYLPTTVPLLKQVGAVAGVRVCACNGLVYVDGVAIVRTLGLDSNGRILASWQQCRALAGDELFLLNPSNKASYDSRYFGPVKTTEVRGRATPLWTWTQP